MLDSKIKKYIGYATETILVNDGAILEALVPEITPMVSQTQPDRKKGDRSIKFFNIKTQVIETLNFTPSDTIECKYLGHLTNRSIPNIHAGERICILNIDGSTDFYWMAMDIDDDIRTVEHLKIRIADKPNQTDKLTDDNSSYIEIDSRPGQRGFRIRLGHGTLAKFAYDIYVDQEAGTMELMDDVGNGIKVLSGDPEGTTMSGTAHDKLRAKMDRDIVSQTRDGGNAPKSKPWPAKVEPSIKAYNNYGSFVDVIGNRILAHADDLVHVTTTHAKVDATEDCIVNTTVSEVNATASALIKTTAATIDASATALVKAPLITLQGATAITETLSVAKGITGGEGISVAGGVSGQTGSFPGGHGPH